MDVWVCALKGQKHCSSNSYNCFCPFRAQISTVTTPGRCPGLMALSPFRGIMQTKGLILFERIYVHRVRGVYRTPIKISSFLGLKKKEKVRQNVSSDAPCEAFNKGIRRARGEFRSHVLLRCCNEHKSCRAMCGDALHGRIRRCRSFR